MEEEDDDRGFITAKDFMNDFATEEFITKNIRVRPTSGVTRADDDAKTTGDGYQSRMTGQDGRDDDEQEKKLDELVRLDLDQERKKQKENYLEFLRRKAAEEEKAKKKRL